MKNTIVSQIYKNKQIEIFVEDGILNLKITGEDFKIRIDSKTYKRKTIYYLDHTNTPRTMAVFAEE